MEARGPGIDKNELNNLLVSGGWGGQGTWTIAAKPKQVKGQQTKFCSKLRIAKQVTQEHFPKKRIIILSLK